MLKWSGVFSYIFEFIQIWVLYHVIWPEKTRSTTTVKICCDNTNWNRESEFKQFSLQNLKRTLHFICIQRTIHNLIECLYLRAELVGEDRTIMTFPILLRIITKLNFLKYSKRPMQSLENYQRQNTLTHSHTHSSTGKTNKAKWISFRKSFLRSSKYFTFGLLKIAIETVLKMRKTRMEPSWYNIALTRIRRVRVQEHRDTGNM